MEHTTSAALPSEATTRRAILTLIVREGPICAATLAERLNLAGAGIRRHLVAMETEGIIRVHDVAGASATRGRGRPARHFVATGLAQGELSSESDKLAIDLLEYLDSTLGEQAVSAYARHYNELFDRAHSEEISHAGPDAAARATVLAGALTATGHAATVRPVGSAHQALQLCQGHCPILPVSSAFPVFCDAETQAFSHLLGVNVQRLATIAAGAHACTTHIPVSQAHAR